MQSNRSSASAPLRAAGLACGVLAGIASAASLADEQHDGAQAMTAPRVGHSMSRAGAESPAEQRASIRRFLELFALDAERGRVGLVATGSATLFEMFAGGAMPPADLVTVRRDLELPTE